MQLSTPNTKITWHATRFGVVYQILKITQVLIVSFHNDKEFREHEHDKL